VSEHDEDPVVARRRLKTELRQARKDAGRTQRDVAQAMDWSTAKLIRIEGGEARISQNDLIVLLDYYEIHDVERVDALLGLARAARSAEWWSDLPRMFTQDSRRHLSYESSASIIRNYQPLLVPGLLQTEEYTRALLRDLYEHSDEMIDRAWDARQGRQRVHERANPPEMYFLIDEAVIRRPIGGPRVMRRQLIRLQEYAGEPYVSVQVMPFSVGAHPGLNVRFVYLEFPDPNDEDVLYLEEPEQIIRENPEETGKYLDRFFKLQDIAMPAAETVAFLDKAIREMEEAAGGP
jgi:transcriptional regulator with XRE-family HTH domain